MSQELIAIILAAIGLAALIVPGQRAIRSDIAGLRERMAHLEGLLEGLREAITGRARGQLTMLCASAEKNGMDNSTKDLTSSARFESPILSRAEPSFILR